MIRFLIAIQLQLKPTTIFCNDIFYLFINVLVVKPIQFIPQRDNLSTNQKLIVFTGILLRSEDDISSKKIKL